MAKKMELSPFGQADSPIGSQVGSPMPSHSQMSQSLKQFYGPALLAKIEGSLFMSQPQKHALKKLTSTLVCTKCNFLYEDPCTIDCSHTFCR
jgi:hypothetical protein